MTPFGVPEAADRFQRQLRAMGVTQALEAAGVRAGDMVHIGDKELEWQE
jgi:GTP-binding protein